MKEENKKVEENVQPVETLDEQTPVEETPIEITAESAPVDPVAEPTPAEPVVEEVAPVENAPVDETPKTEEVKEEPKEEVPVQKKKTNKPLLIIILVIFMAFIFGLGFYLGKQLFEKDNKCTCECEPCNTETPTNTEIIDDNSNTENNNIIDGNPENQKTDEELISELNDIINTTRNTFDSQNITDDIKNLESTYFTENGISELQSFICQQFNTFVFDSAACNAPESIFSSTGHCYGDYSISLRTDDLVTLSRAVGGFTTSDACDFNGEMKITFKKEGDNWKIDQFIN